MNYKASREGDQELLLSFGGHLDDNTATTRLSKPQKTEGLSDVTTSPADPILTPQRPCPDKEEISVDLQNGNSVQSRDDVQFLSGDTLGILSSVSSTIDKQGKKYEGSFPDASSPEWVSFEESSNHANLQDQSADMVLPNQVTANGDDSVPVKTTTTSDNWVTFGVANLNKEKPLSRSVSKPDVVASQVPRQHTKDELLLLEESLLGSDIFTNPFDNRELNRINPFSQISPRQDIHNGSSYSSDAITHTVSHYDEPCDTPQSEMSSNTSLSVERNAEGTLATNESESLPPLTEYPEKPTNKTWPVLLRYPDTKRKLRARVWRPVVIKLEGSILQVYEEHDRSAPFREVSLQCFYSLTKPTLQQYHGGKVHTVKLLYVKYKETQKYLSNSKNNVEYVARTTPILKIASTSHLVMQEFTEVINDAIRSLPIFRDRGISHNTEAVYIDVQDTCSALLDSTGSVLMLGILVRIYLRAFISGDAECQLVLNDHHLKSQEITRLRGEHMPQNVRKWINLENCNFHSTVNPDIYNQNRYILFKPLDSCTFEVMQFRVRQLKPLPLLAHCDLIVDGHGRIELKAEVKLCNDPKLAKYERKNICLYFPIPEIWISLFMKEKIFRGEKSIQSISAKKAIKKRNRFNRPACTIEVSTGSAKYEPEYRAIVWRINQLPLLNTTLPADTPHDFTCHIQTRDVPESFKPHCVMEYEIPYTVASDTNIVNFKVSDKKITTQEVTYCAYYSYHIQMNATSLNGEAKGDGWTQH